MSDRVMTISRSGAITIERDDCVIESHPDGSYKFRYIRAVLTVSSGEYAKHGSLLEVLDALARNRLEVSLRSKQYAEAWDRLRLLVGESQGDLEVARLHET